MPTFILKLDNIYCEWSTIVDAPVSYFMPLDNFKDYYQRMYGENGMKELPERLERVERTGCSGIGIFANDLIRGNRAGEDEKSLSKSRLLKEYSIKQTDTQD